MRRLIPIIPVGMLVLFGLMAISANLDVRAQEATPAGDTADDEISVDELAYGSIPAFPSLPADIELSRVHFAPGSSIETPGEDLGLSLVYVESGTVILSRTVPNLVTHGAALATPGAQAQEQVPANTEITLEAGDFYVAPPFSGGTMRNVGTEEATVLIAGLVPVGDATPTPEP